MANIVTNITVASKSGEARSELQSILAKQRAKIKSSYSILLDDEWLPAGTRLEDLSDLVDEAREAGKCYQIFLNKTGERRNPVEIESIAELNEIIANSNVDLTSVRFRLFHRPANRD